MLITELHVKKVNFKCRESTYQNKKYLIHKFEAKLKYKQWIVGYLK
jgi:hypothetical protein